jgi:hypothetical protein
MSQAQAPKLGASPRPTRIWCCPIINSTSWYYYCAAQRLCPFRFGDRSAAAAWLAPTRRPNNSRAATDGPGAGLALGNGCPCPARPACWHDICSGLSDRAPAAPAGGRGKKGKDDGGSQPRVRLFGVARWHAAAAHVDVDGQNRCPPWMTLMRQSVISAGARSQAAAVRSGPGTTPHLPWQVILQPLLVRLHVPLVLATTRHLAQHYHSTEKISSTRAPRVRLQVRRGLFIVERRGI